MKIINKAVKIVTSKIGSIVIDIPIEELIRWVYGKIDNNMTTSGYLISIPISILLLFLFWIFIDLRKTKRKNEELRLFLLSYISQQHNIDLPNPNNDIVKGIKEKFNNRLNINGYEEKLTENEKRDLLNKMFHNEIKL